MIRQSIYKDVLIFNVYEIWNAVVDREKTDWRSDLIKTEILTEKNFKEYSIEGTETTFKITEIKEKEYYAFNMKNSFFKGYWRGEFIPLNDQVTENIFYEKKYFKNPLFYVASLFKLNLKKIQKNYVED
ncbi:MULTISPECIES: hypothetical protein [Vagococcus]|uniref:SRPBCC family protein n=1 Tax=Vagococcus fluvialis bH819 TaxID=1255619 RepID=A0A1X6WMN1_9ENTE|nr:MULTISPECIES: hypothetical protein [Vagococcus]SLM85482.1 hypothetical protein FM121_05240 [Vagococcus fluvialis bH819]HCM89223.1 hypothetical protein [Vagococcus sp.]